MTSRSFGRVSWVAFLLLALVAQLPAAEATRNTGPWDVKELAKTPQIEWGATNGLVREVYYSSEPFQGKPTRVFGYYARPAGEGPFPAMVLLHGGGGKAFPEWAKLWAERGYVALAMDLAGKGPAGKPLSDGGPGQDDTAKFGKFDDDHVKEMWTYHAVAAALRGHSLLAAQKEVDAQRIGVTGISWGGYLTCIVAGVDERLKVAVPVYGCGFLQENSVWRSGYFDKMTEEQRHRWGKNFDPSSYLAGVSCPILFVNGTNDFAYPLDSYQKSYHLVKEQLVDLCITVNMPHGHPQGWTPKEIGIFVDSVVNKGKPLPRFSEGELTRAEGQLKIVAEVPVVSAQFHYTTDEGPWQKRTWKTVDAKLAGDTVHAAFPEKFTVLFFTIRDERGAVASSDYIDLTRPVPAQTPMNPAVKVKND
ncbi:MAG TPA: prolyl oligopeptidase family serine peptidase [Pirellulaceae bacterium]|nr:prolyl oligopeptidase family serine peptidase [Pirellulaceae bacterium]